MEEPSDSGYLRADDRLIVWGGFSPTGHLCGVLKYHDLVTFVGTELGATFTCTGNVKYPTLKHTHLFLGTAIERRYSAAVEGMDPKRRGKT